MSPTIIASTKVDIPVEYRVSAKVRSRAMLEMFIILVIMGVALATCISVQPA